MINVSVLGDSMNIVEKITAYGWLKVGLGRAANGGGRGGERSEKLGNEGLRGESSGSKI